MASRSLQFCNLSQSESRQKRRWDSSQAEPAGEGQQFPPSDDDCHTPRLSGARRLRFRRGARRHASLADLYCAFGMMFLRGCYHQILRPHRHFAKFAHAFCRHAKSRSTSTCILAGRPPSATCSAAMPLGLYRCCRLPTAGQPYHLIDICRAFLAFSVRKCVVHAHQRVRRIF